MDEIHECQAGPVAQCHRCGHAGRRHTKRTRRLRDIRDGRCVVVLVAYGTYWCQHCGRFFVPRVEGAARSARYGSGLKAEVLDTMHKQNLTLEATSQLFRARWGVRIPITTLHDWDVESRNQLASGANLGPTQ